MEDDFEVDYEVHCCKCGHSPLHNRSCNNFCDDGFIDESEDLTEDQFKMIGERVSAGSVINFVGDYNQVTESKYSKNSGLKRAIKNLAGNPKVGIIVFDDNEKDNVRSEVSKVFTSVY